MSVRVSLRYMLMLVRVDTLRRGYTVGFSRRAARIMFIMNKAAQIDRHFFPTYRTILTPLQQTLMKTLAKGEIADHEHFYF